VEIMDENNQKEKVSIGIVFESAIK
jgi:hypothetical protein